MDLYEYTELLKNLGGKISNLKTMIDVDKLLIQITDIKRKENDPASWTDNKALAKLGMEKSRIEKLLKSFNDIDEQMQDALIMFELVQEEGDEAALNDIFNKAPELEKSIKSFEVSLLLDEEYDHANAIISIQPGAGGTESQDWGSILYRMYLRWAQRRGFKSELIDFQEGEEAGIKGVSFIVKGENAYGYLKNDSGIHRLVRISPFDSNAKRHTSFASVQITPEVDDDINIIVEDKDLRIDYYRASGAGGQHVNKTDSAVRITHIPSGIVVQCQNDRSQHKNKSMALKMLKSKLYALEKQKQHTKMQGEEKSLMGWGHQIRSFVLAPYQQVKDLRTQKAYTAVNGILDGDIDEILEDCLIFSKSQS